MNHLNRRKYKNRSSIYSIDNKQTINKIAQVENDIAQWEWNEIPPENITQYELHLSSNNDDDIEMYHPRDSEVDR